MLCDLTGQRFGFLTVIRHEGYRWGKRAWLCVCDCGKETTVITGSLTSGNTQSCGCFHRAVISRMNKQIKPRRTHGMRNTPEYRAWINMKSRCYNPNVPYYKWYGERGISICKEWLDNFAAFYEHIGPRPGKGYSIDRINNDGDYEPGNIRWATTYEQRNNRRLK